MSDKVREYLEAGKRLELDPQGWTMREFKALAIDGKNRLPRYRRAIEAALAEISKMEHRDDSRESQAVDYALAYVREAMRSALLEKGRGHD